MQCDPYLRLCSSVQARRRFLEGIDSALAGAAGVRATLFAHQLTAVRHVLTDTRIRHLLADEVGLGKSVEALMIINAFRLLHPKSLIAIVVPEPKRQEWLIDELWYRGHSLPEGFLPEQRDIDITQTRLWPPRQHDPVPVHGEIFVLWPGLRYTHENTHVAVLPRVLERFDLVIVDEIHNLTQELRDYLVRSAARIPNLLLLSATPRLQDPDRRLEILSLIEPERLRSLFLQMCTECNVAATPFHEFRQWPQEVRERVLTEVQANWAKLTRRIVRSRRSDLRGVALPARTVTHHSIEPTEHEVTRCETVGKVCRNLPIPVNRIQFYRRAIIGGQTLSDRTSELLRERSDLPPELADLQRQLDPSAATDSRVDALTVLLLEVWRNDPTEKVLVCCHDAPTVDYLRRRLSSRMPVVGPVSSPLPLRIAAAGNALEVTVALDRFKNGDAQILLAANIAHLGLNLQVARILVFYSTPWTVEDIDQWIGRLDRITNSAIYRHDADGDVPTRDLHVHVLVHHGQVDESIAAFFESKDVYREVNDLDDFALITWIDKSVSNIALGEPAPGEQPQRANTNVLPRFDQSDYIAALNIVRHNPPQTPALVDTRTSTGFKARAIAAEQWLQLFKASRPSEYDYRVDVQDSATGRSFRTLWYRPRQQLADPVKLRCLGDPLLYAESSIQAFETRRPELAPSPRLLVHHKVAGQVVPRHLQFFDHGGGLHDELVGAWCELPNTAWPERIVCVKVRCPREHPAYDRPGDGNYFVTVGWFDPAADLLHFGDTSTNVLNDCWWLRDHFGAQMLLYGEKILLGGKREIMPPDASINVLRPFYEAGDADQLQRRVMSTSRKEDGTYAADTHKLEGRVGTAVEEHQARALSKWRDELGSKLKCQSARHQAAGNQRRTQIQEELQSCEELRSRLPSGAAARPEPDLLAGRIHELSRRLEFLTNAVDNRCEAHSCITRHLTFWLKLSCQ
jgi:ATP-dependent helicase HepA